MARICVNCQKEFERVNADALCCSKRCAGVMRRTSKEYRSLMNKRRQERPHNKLRRCWSSMIDRCHNPGSQEYAKYGGRGIAVCERWRNSFDAFASDMGFRPSPKHSLDRINNNLGYEPTNCRWATQLEQCNNKRNNVFLTALGKTQTASEWSRETGFSVAVIYTRLKMGWDDEKVVTKPLQKHKRRTSTLNMEKVL